MRKTLVLFAVLLLGSGIRPAAADPPFSVEEEKLDTALSCTPFTHPAHEPVLLVHGTFTSGHEQYRWNYELLLADSGNVCPGRIVDHLAIGTTDRATQTLVLDALTHDGPADPVRAGLGSLCALPDQYADQRQPGEFIGQFADSFGSGFPNFHTTNREPALKSYAQ